MAKKVNGYIKWFGVSVVIAGIIWNAAVMHTKVNYLAEVLSNEVAHINKDIQEIKNDVGSINDYLMDHFLERSKK